MTLVRVFRSRFVFMTASSLALFSGCVGQNSLLTSRTTVGSLRTSVSHLSYENEQLRRQMADLKAENRGLEDRLVQEEAHNGDLAARLDDARHALRSQGLDDFSGSGSESSSTPRTTPARSTKKRKVPYAQIPGGIEAAPADDSDAPGPQSRRDDDYWVPVARVPSLSTDRVR